MVDAPVRSGDAGEVWLGGTADGSTCSVVACGTGPARLATWLFATEADRTAGAAPVGESSGEACNPGIGIGLEVGFAVATDMAARMSCPLVADCAAGTVA